MNLILPGLNVINKELMAPLCHSLGSSWELLEYPWWHSEDSKLEIEVVLEAIKSKCSELIIAKSIGTLFTALALKDMCHLPKAMVFIGIPKKAINTSEYQLIQKAVKESGIPILVIQQGEDHLGAFREIKSDLLGANVEFEMIEGHDHLYNDKLTIQILVSWLAKISGYLEAAI